MERRLTFTRSPSFAWRAFGELDTARNLTLAHLLTNRYGSPYVELSDSSVIQGSHGLTTTIEYSGKGWVSGKAHTFKAVIAKGPHVSLSNSLYTIEGQWNGESHFAKGSPADKIGQLFIDAAGPTNPITVKPIEEQNEYESRRAWKVVADGIKKGELCSANSRDDSLGIPQVQ